MRSEPQPRGSRLPLWDVENVEAHVRAVLKSALNDMGARLNAKQTEKLNQFLFFKCWQISGLRDDGNCESCEGRREQRDSCSECDGTGRRIRWVWRVNCSVAPVGGLEPYVHIRLPLFSSEQAATFALKGIVCRLEERGRRAAFPGVERVRPPSAYDPSKGLSFSTYSHRLLTFRVTDWYRADEEFGDTRYSSGQRNESLEALAWRASRDQDGDVDVDRFMPGGRLGFIDQLNSHAYQESNEEIVTRETVYC